MRILQPRFQLEWRTRRAGFCEDEIQASWLDDTGDTVLSTMLSNIAQPADGLEFGVEVSRQRLLCLP